MFPACGGVVVVELREVGEEEEEGSGEDLAESVEAA